MFRQISHRFQIRNREGILAMVVEIHATPTRRGAGFRRLSDDFPSRKRCIGGGIHTQITDPHPLAPECGCSIIWDDSSYQLSRSSID